MFAYFNPVWIETREQAAELAERARASQTPVALDTETTGLDRFGDVIAVWSLCIDGSEAYMLRASHLDQFRSVFEDESVSWFFHNYQFDAHMLANHGCHIKGRVYDTLIMDWLYDENKQGLRKLGQVADRHLGVSKDSFDKVFGGEAHPLEWYEQMIHQNINQLLVYATKDAWLTYKVGMALMEKLRHQGLLEIYENHFAELLKTIWSMERRGVLIDIDYLNMLRDEMNQQMTSIHRRIMSIVGRPININSTHQLAQYFFVEQGIEPVKYTKGGKPSTNSEALKTLAQNGNTVAKLILEYRQFDKLVGTFLNGLEKSINKKTNRVHTHFHISGTRTGRLSSSSPNLQNIPARTELGHKLRDLFTCSPDKLMIVSDYSQLEMRILAHFSEDENMINIIKSGWDIHSGTASLMFDVPYEEIVAAKKADEPDKRQLELIRMRSHAKNIGFGLVYGMTARRLANDLGIEEKEAEELMEKFFNPFPGVKKFINDTINRVHADLQVTTLIGRPRRLPSILASGAEQAKAERQAVNTVIQGTAADIASAAMIAAEKDERLKELGAELLLQIHDELVFEVPSENAEKAVPIVKDIMEHVVELRVPLVADPGVGVTWGEAKL